MYTEHSDGTLVNGDATSYVESLEGQGMALDLPGGTAVKIYRSTG